VEIILEDDKKLVQREIAKWAKQRANFNSKIDPSTEDEGLLERLADEALFALEWVDEEYIYELEEAGENRLCFMYAKIDPGELPLDPYYDIIIEL